MPKYLVLPKIGMNMEEAYIAEWLIKPGDHVKKEQMVIRAETDKAVQDLFATESGIVYRLLVKPGEVVACQQKIAILLDEGEEYVGEEEDSKDPVDSVVSTIAGDSASVPELSSILESEDCTLEHPHRISPLARKMAKELGISINQLQPEKPGKRIVKADILRFQEQKASSCVSLSEGESDSFVPLDRTRQIIAKRMTESANQKPRVSLSTTVNCTELSRWREQLKQERKVTYNEIIAKACAEALQKFPTMNCISVEGGHRVLKAVNIGVAVDTPRGLMVPVLKNVEGKGVLQLADEFEQLVTKARMGTLSMEEMNGGTFSISNLGMYDVEFFDPIINAPECLILGVGCMKEVPVVVEHNLCTRVCMQISLAFDHTAFDGATAAKLLQKIKLFLEHPVLMLS